MKNVFKKIFNIFASFGLTIILLSFGFLVILFGTLYQVDHGLYMAQKKYFDSMIVMHQMGPVVIPLPGAYIIMVLFTINLICGGMVRIRKSKHTVGILITHFGILVMMISGALTFHFSDRGHMTLYETQSSNEFVSYTEWMIEMGRPGKGETRHTIPQKYFDDLKGDQSRTFYNDEIPFEIAVKSYHRNAFVSPVRPVMPTDAEKVLNGFFIDPLDIDTQAERNRPAVLVELTDKESGKTEEAILWGLAREPFTFQAGGEPWLINLEPERWQVPFVITLDEFIHEKHAGTEMASSYESYVIKKEDGEEEKIRIWMNHPLRHNGYTFFQESWGPSNAGPNDPLFSQFAVVRNPGDQGPLYACIIVSIGMLVHFVQKLLGYMRIEAKRRTT